MKRPNMRRLFSRAAILALGVCVHVGCASHTSHSLADRFMVHRQRSETRQQEDAPPPPSLEEAIGKVRRLMAEARPEPKGAPARLESHDPALAQALANLS